MDWKRIAPWNWFKDEQSPAVTTQTPARIDPGSDPFTTLRGEMERLFDETFSRSFPVMPRESVLPRRLPTPLRPSIDISEGKKAYTVRAELPGIELGDVSIQTEGQTLVIQAEKRQESDEEDEGYHWVERSYGVVQRVLSLPDDADSEAVDARFKNGVLKLRIPKHPARSSTSRNIEVQQG